MCTSGHVSQKIHSCPAGHGLMPMFLLGQIKGYSTMPKDSLANQLRPPSGVCETPDPQARTLSERGSNSVEALLRCSVRTPLPLVFHTNLTAHMPMWNARPQVPPEVSCRQMVSELQEKERFPPAVTPALHRGQENKKAEDGLQRMKTGASKNEKNGPRRNVYLPKRYRHSARRSQES
nr:uncharacterized protein LOC105706853 [Aotus nancymaae]